MASDPQTPYLGLTKPIVGDPEGEDLWGEKLNTNFDKIDTFAATLSPETIDWNSVTGKPEAYPPASHTHTPSEVTGLEAALDDLAADIDNLALIKEPIIPAGDPAQVWFGDKVFRPIPAPSWASVTGKPTTYPSTPHTHAQSEVTGLGTALAGKEPVIAAGPPEMFWAGDKTWKAVAGGGSATTIGDTLPATAVHGALHWESDTGALFIRFDDGTSQQWVQVTGGNASTISTAAPSGGADGDVWYQVV